MYLYLISRSSNYTFRSAICCLLRSRSKKIHRSTIERLGRSKVVHNLVTMFIIQCPEHHLNDG